MNIIFRVRKISVYDLVDALEKALKLEKKRNYKKVKVKEKKVKKPEKEEVDLQTRMKNILQEATAYFKANLMLTFDQLVSSAVHQHLNHHEQTNYFSL